MMSKRTASRRQRQRCVDQSPAGLWPQIVGARRQSSIAVRTAWVSGVVVAIAPVPAAENPCLPSQRGRRRCHHPRKKTKRWWTWTWYQWRRHRGRGRRFDSKLRREARSKRVRWMQRALLIGRSWSVLRKTPWPVEGISEVAARESLLVVDSSPLRRRGIGAGAVWAGAAATADRLAKEAFAGSRWVCAMERGKVKAQEREREMKSRIERRPGKGREMAAEYPGEQSCLPSSIGCPECR